MWWMAPNKMRKTARNGYYLEIICNKAVDDGIHTAVQAAESDSQVVDDHMMRHVGVEIHHHLRHKETAQPWGRTLCWIKAATCSVLSSAHLDNTVVPKFLACHQE